MEQNSKIEICRTCLKEIEKNEHISVYMISSILMSFTSLNISEDDGLPANICSNCYKQANDAYQFKLLCEKSDTKLQKIYLNDCKDVNTFENSNMNYTSFVTDFPNITNIKLDDEVIKSEIEEVFPITDEIDNFNCESEINKTEVKQLSTSIVKENKFFACKLCNASFIQQAWLLKHEAKHSERHVTKLTAKHEIGFTCNICSKKFTTYKNLGSHIRRHNNSSHLCDTCGKQFTLLENLIVHQRIHNGIRPYKCKQCNKSFTQSNELKSHMITHTSEKPHLCNLCGNKFARKVTLKAHIKRTHSNTRNLRPHKCIICNGSFREKPELKRHLKIHNGEKPYVCKTCGKSFNRNSHLKVHEGIHSGLRPFTCHICERSFTQKHVLNTHLKTHSK